MTGFLKTAQSDLAIERKILKARHALGIANGDEITVEAVRKAFRVAVSNAHPDAAKDIAYSTTSTDLNVLRSAKDLLVKFLENADGPN